MAGLFSAINQSFGGAGRSGYDEADLARYRAEIQERLAERGMERDLQLAQLRHQLQLEQARYASGLDQAKVQDERAFAAQQAEAEADFYRRNFGTPGRQSLSPYQQDPDEIAFAGAIPGLYNTTEAPGTGLYTGVAPGSPQEAQMRFLQAHQQAGIPTMTKSGQAMVADLMQQRGRQLFPEPDKGSKYPWAPVYGTVDGAPVAMQFDNQGRPNYTQLQFLPQGEVNKTPEGQAQIARAKESGKDDAEFVKTYPSTRRMYEQQLGHIKDLLSPKFANGLDWLTGKSGMLPSWINQDYRDAQIRHDQILSESFMAAREGLKGAGQVTDFEGRKGELAMVRLANAQSKEEYAAAAAELAEMLRTSLREMKLRAKRLGLPEGQEGEPAPGSAPSQDSYWGKATVRRDK